MRRFVDAGTPIVNNSFLEDIRAGKAKYIRGDILEIVPEGIKFNLRRDPHSTSGDSGEEVIIEADVIVSVRRTLDREASTLTAASHAGYRLPTTFARLPPEGLVPRRPRRAEV